MARKYKNADEKRIKNNLRRAISRAKNNTKPLRIGRDRKGNTLYIHGKQAQKERIRLAKSNAQYQMSTIVDKTRPQREDAFNINAGNMDFRSRSQYNNYMKWHSQTAQRQILKDRGNSIRQSFRTRAENIGVSNEVTNRLEKYFKTHTNDEILAEVVKNTQDGRVTFEELFDSDQEVTIQQNYLQMARLFVAVGLEKDISGLDLSDVETSDYNFNQWTGWDVDQAIAKSQRREQGRV